MSFFISRNRKVPYIDNSVLNPASPVLNEAQRASWAFAIGERRPSTDPPRGRRPSRSDLPDVDFSRAVPIDRPSLLQRLARFVGLARPAPQPQPEEWRVVRDVSDRDLPARHDNVIHINRAA